MPLLDNLINAFSFLTLQGARGNESSLRQRAFSLRIVGDVARYVERPGPTSPLFPGHGMRPGERLREGAPATPVLARWQALHRNRIDRIAAIGMVGDASRKDCGVQASQRLHCS